MPAETGATSSHASPTIRLIEALAGITAFLTAFGYQVGRHYTASYYRYFGLDADLLNMSAYDIIRYSLTPIFPLFGLLLINATIALLIYTRIISWAKQNKKFRQTHRMAQVLIIVGSTIPIPAVISTILPTSYVELFFLPLTVTGGAFLIFCGLQMQLHGKDMSPVKYSTRASANYNGLLIVFAIWGFFWFADSSAGVAGESRGQEVASKLSEFPSVVIFSEKSLNIEQPGVTEEQLESPNSLYGFKYVGLHQLAEGDGLIFLIPQGWTHSQGGVWGIEKNGSERIEFHGSK